MPQLVLLAGGLGTRLGAATRAVPKPLLPIAGKPFIRYLIEDLRRFGIDRVLILAGYLGAQFSAFVEEASIPGVELSVLIEPEPLGTGGALRFAAPHLEETFLLANADSLFSFNYLDLVRPPQDSAWLGKLALRLIDNAERYGVVQMDGARITGFAARGQAGPGLINGGVYLLRRDIIRQIGPGTVSLEGAVFPAVASAGRLFGQVFEGPFIDIGVPETLAAADEVVPAILTRKAAFLDRDGVLNIDHGYVHKPEEFQWIPGAKAAVKALNDAGYWVIVITNQAGVARGFYEEADIHALHQWINEKLLAEGAHIDAFYYCPHHPDGVVAAYATACADRKPEPGLILRALAEWPTRKGESFLIGDKESDMAAARAAGIAGHLFKGGDLEQFVAGLLAKSTSR